MITMAAWRRTPPWIDRVPACVDDGSTSCLLRHDGARSSARIRYRQGDLWVSSRAHPAACPWPEVDVSLRRTSGKLIQPQGRVPITVDGIVGCDTASSRRLRPPAIMISSWPCRPRLVDGAASSMAATYVSRSRGLCGPSSEPRKLASRARIAINFVMNYGEGRSPRSMSRGLHRNWPHRVPSLDTASAAAISPARILP